MESHEFDEDLARKLLCMYHDRCKFKHALAFLQFRSTLPDADHEQLKRTFENRKDHLKAILNKVVGMIAEGMLESYAPMKEA